MAYVSSYRLFRLSFVGLHSEKEYCYIESSSWSTLCEWLLNGGYRSLGIFEMLEIKRTDRIPRGYEIKRAQLS